MSSTRSPLCAVALFAFVVLVVAFSTRNWRSEDAKKTLLEELRARQQEILPFYPTKDGDTLSGTSAGSDVDAVACSQLARMQIAALLGSGYTKTVVQALLPPGPSVALKSVNHRGSDMRQCLEQFHDPMGCHQLVSFKLKKEIILLQRLQHPNIIKLKGHCQDGRTGRGITAILEQGTPLEMIQLLQSPWEERFRVCLGLVRLLHYLSQSPLGSVALLDFQSRQFVLVDGELKLTDLDDANVKEPTCQSDSDCMLQFPLRNFSFHCSEQRICEGMNEMRNLYNAYRYFFMYLLPHQAPPMLQPLVKEIMNSTGELKKGIASTLEAFEEILHIFKSGHHLENLPPLVIRDYVAVRGVSSVGSVNYRCWPSYSHQGCVLSVHSVTEAADICRSQPQCSSFTVQDQRTWTGRLLASFQSSFSHLVPDVNSVVYVRKMKASLVQAL
ncbi:extracellular tyrosine-protein kinase PKDCC [Denticeps clupeoides]|uniref:Extracellular tyrosine-protein kinase PKDCC n=1 Tax=Denticeps clupeoides TaxID=299321 RepID=A0AAY4C055_9TELE|nr:extracellular tyrosine-protein kinase PKDCC-like [Denticeps clupeoides]